ncbi:N-acetylglucosamine-6-phosphate deacetylase [Roseateles saccharophilus]|uniref:N-acetylglucosamine 6-phosphate deacetylase n=1 Tax=Roseateles saccharophilus TaxID=304 RepID=A0A4R3UEQ7_ROSSA|nr:N-acetylglucosamine-6-phosphate deacetylase [Roseateles saccharophilus]MDG0835438.1 N-acetylglucosamine-6-phosphate deacetylase [Roseateles saccharophilus]TCU86327.1 N-acetylglucosamine 6-phosphate deacetylase [Roseateles saccharophilus]
MRIEGDIVTPQGVITGHLDIEHGRIAVIDGEPVDPARAGEAGRPILLPGFIDTHVHGGGGRDTMEGGDAIATIARRHARHGTTALLATTMTAPLGEIEAALQALGPVCRERGARQARVLGVHLEGPYINPGRLGAQPAHAIPATLAEVLRLNALAPIRVLTLAPEVPGHLALIGPLRDAGIRVQIGHSNGSYEDGVAALGAGAAGFTHLFNAMSGLHHREPGMVGAALAHGEHAELIPDLLHVHPGAIRAALRCIPGLFCVTDSTAAAGMPDGDYRLGEYTVRKCMGGVRLADGTLAGSALTMDQALRNLVQRLELPLTDAVRRVSTAAAEYLGLADRGRLAPGAWADVVVMDAGLELRRVFVEGEEIDVVADA